MSLKSFLAASALLAPVLATPPVCSASYPLSCHNTSAITNTCCTEVQGQVLQVQFWDTDPATGPADHWTIHGLWPDYCDGSYTEDCDPSRDYTNISCILESYDKVDLLAFMEDYWKNDNGENQELWEHEWYTHGTCYSTLNPDCYTNYTPQEEVVDFFEQVVNIFQTLPTYTWLEDAGITPSSTKTYTYAEILQALYTPRGVNATLECDDDELYEVEYTFNVKGSVADGSFVPENPVGETSSCPSTGIKYLPKNLSSTPATKNTETCAASLAPIAAAASLEAEVISAIASQAPS